ncbi:hypothetical protein VNI00_000162 [Paramarasmius palmivorus]|uniref:RRM domain-containing protein n=1 Tax=Paramarasmius palmivorus TaxID=297713 RepID=A0AAW0EEA3_9AGAR
MRKPHPSLQKPRLFIEDLPKNVELNVIRALFRQFPDAFVVLKKTPPKQESKFARAEFDNCENAEKAMALLQNREIPNMSPPQRVSFSTSLSQPILPLFTSSPRAKIRMVPRRSDSMSCAEIYDALRVYGPIYSIYEENVVATIVQFWGEEDACDAEEGLTEKKELGLELQLCNPCSVYVSSLPPDVISHTALSDMFVEFGKVIDSRLVSRRGGSQIFGFVTYETREEAFKAIESMHGKKIGKKKLHVSLKQGRSLCTTAQGQASNTSHEQTQISEPPFQPSTPEPTFSVTEDEPLHSRDHAASSPTLVGEDPENEVHSLSSKMDLAEKIAQTWKDETVRLREEMESLRTREADTLTELESVRDSNRQLREELARLKEDNSRQKALLVGIQLSHEKANKEISDLETLLEDSQLEVEYYTAEAKRFESSLAKSQKEVERLSAEVRAAREEGSKTKIKDSKHKRKLLELENDRPKWEEARKAREAKEKEEELEFSRRRMKRLQEEEAERAQAKIREELARQRREEEERKAKEKAERERAEKELQEKLRREQAWKKATLQEKERCKQRDAQLLCSYYFWTEVAAVARFKCIVDEFEKTKFSELKPLIHEAIPWPVYKNPSTFVLEDVQWDAVERFFEVLRRHLDHSSYRALTERCNRLFHPDRWKARNILKTVMDANERLELEEAGNIVSQAITPLWQKCRGT